MPWRYCKDGWIGYCQCCGIPFQPFHLFIYTGDNSVDKTIKSYEDFENYKNEEFLGCCYGCLIKSSRDFKTNVVVHGVYLH